jgi:hypothetical protein
MLSADQRQLDAGLLRYPRAMVVDAEKWDVFNEYAWAAARGPTPNGRLIFLDAVKATSWTHQVAEAWRAFHSLQEAHSPVPRQQWREALRARRNWGRPPRLYRNRAQQANPRAVPPRRRPTAMRWHGRSRRRAAGQPGCIQGARWPHLLGFDAP